LRTKQVMRNKPVMLVLLSVLSLILLGGCHIFFEDDRPDLETPPELELSKKGDEEVIFEFVDDEQWRQNLEEVTIYLVAELKNNGGENRLFYQEPDDFEIEPGKLTVYWTDEWDPFEPFHIPPYLWNKDEVPFFLFEVSAAGFSASRLKVDLKE